jgi:hypothetical protein
MKLVCELNAEVAEDAGAKQRIGREAERLVVGQQCFQAKALEAEDGGQVGVRAPLHVGVLSRLHDHTLDRAAGRGEVALRPEHRGAAETGTERRVPVADGQRRGFGDLIGPVRGLPVGLEPVEPGGEQGQRREVRGAHPASVGPRGEREHVERLGQASLVLQEIGERGEAGANGGHCGSGVIPQRIDESGQVASLGPRLVQLLDVAGRAVALPAVGLAVILGGDDEPALGQAKHEIAGERAAGRRVVLARAFIAGAFQELLVPPGHCVCG